MLAAVLQSLVICAQATVLFRANNEGSALYNANLTELSLCLSRLNETITVHSNYGISGRESLVIDIAPNGRDKDEVEAMNPNSGFIYRIYECLEKQGVYKAAVLNFGDDCERFEWQHFVRNDQPVIYRFNTGSPW